MCVVYTSDDFSGDFLLITLNDGAWIFDTMISCGRSLSVFSIVVVSTIK